MRYCALVEYDGTGYFGFQRQRQKPTIQEELEQAIEAVSGQETTIIGAGRTDSGVHASGQVIAFEIAWQHAASDLLKAINASLSRAIAIREIKETEPSFHPRFDATARRYEYYIYNKPVRSPLRRHHCWHVIKPLDLDLLNRAASMVQGEHDFATFGRPPVGENTVRKVLLAEWNDRKGFLVFTIEATAFLNRMVRSLVGTMKAVGEGRWSTESFLAALEACDRSRAGQTAPAHGLYLVSVSYE
jgi:tRNA pseudouridine38-40 synthase